MEILTQIEPIAGAIAALMGGMALFYKRKSEVAQIGKSYEQAKLEGLHEVYDKLIDKQAEFNNELSRQVDRLTTEIDRLTEENKLLADEVERLTLEVKELRARLEPNA